MVEDVIVRGKLATVVVVVVVVVVAGLDQGDEARLGLRDCRGEA